MLTDKFNRVHNYLRISLTDNCNLRCMYCMPEEHYEFTPHARLMQLDEIETIAKTFVQLGVKKIRLTGGEPLIRKEARSIILALSQFPVELTLTTNGTRLHEFADILQEAGVKSVNISLDTLVREKFQMLTRRDSFTTVMRNIQLMIDRGFHVKLNAVVMKGINDSEILDFVNWTKDAPVHVRFIEFMPFQGNQWASNKVVTLNEILQAIESEYSFLPLKKKENDTSKGYIVPGHLGTFSVISTMSSPFCSTCNRMRLTADGKMKNCLFSEHETDLLSALRKGEDIVPLIIGNIHSKAKELGGQFSSDLQMIHPEEIHNRSMIAIGG